MYKYNTDIFHIINTEYGHVNDSNDIKTYGCVV